MVVTVECGSDFVASDYSMKKKNDVVLAKEKTIEEINAAAIEMKQFEKDMMERNKKMYDETYEVIEKKLKSKKKYRNIIGGNGVEVMKVLKIISYSNPNRDQVIEDFDWTKCLQRIFGTFSPFSPFSRLRKFYASETRSLDIHDARLLELELSNKHIVNIFLTFLRGIPSGQNKTIYDKKTGTYSKFGLKCSEIDDLLILTFDGFANTIKYCSEICGRLKISKEYHHMKPKFTENLATQKKYYEIMQDSIGAYACETKSHKDILCKVLYAYRYPISDLIEHACEHIGKELDDMIVMEKDYQYNSLSVGFQTNLYALSMYTYDTCANAIVLNHDFFKPYFQSKFDNASWIKIKELYNKKIKDKSVGVSSNSHAVKPESYQYSAMRIAIQCWYKKEDPKGSIENIKELYTRMNSRCGTFGSPVDFNSGTKKPQLASCFVDGFDSESDSLAGIYEMNQNCALYAKSGGGIGLSLTNLRPNGAPINGGGNGGSQTPGLKPVLKLFNDTTTYVGQNDGKRKTNIAMSLDCTHPEIIAFLESKDNNGKDHERARDLFYAVNYRDVFIEVLRARGEQIEREAANRKTKEEPIVYYLICPYKFPHLYDLYGQAFTDEYYNIVKAYKDILIPIDPVKIWVKHYEAASKTGTPYLIFIDDVNAKHNYNGLYLVRNVNLCTEVTQRLKSMCFISTIALPMHVKLPNRYGSDGYKRQYKLNTCGADILKYIDWDKLALSAKVFYRSIRRFCDVSWYPSEILKKNTLDDGNTSIGTQGWDEVLYELEITPDSEEAKLLTFHIFDTIYYHCVKESMELSKKDYTSAISSGTRQDELKEAKKNGIVEGLPHKTFYGTHFSYGRMQFDLWGKTDEVLSGSQWDWKTLKDDVKKHGVVSILMTGLPPTASKSSFLGFSEANERATGVIYLKRTLAGDSTVVNSYMLNDLEHWGLLNESNMKSIISNDGTLAGLDWVPDDMKKLYASVFDISQKVFVDLSAIRAWFVDQSESANRFFATPTYEQFSKMALYSHGKVKTGFYYLRQRGAGGALKISASNINFISEDNDVGECDSDDDENDNIIEARVSIKKKGHVIGKNKLLSPLIINTTTSTTSTVKSSYDGITTTEPVVVSSNSLNVLSDGSSSEKTSPDTPFVFAINNTPIGHKSMDMSLFNSSSSSLDEEQFIPVQLDELLDRQKAMGNSRFLKRMKKNESKEDNNTDLTDIGCIYCE